MEKGTFRALLHFTPALSKGLIAKGAAGLPQIRRAFEKGKVVISTGSTTTYIYRELSGRWPEGALACGMVTAKGLCVGRGMTDFLGAYGYAKYWYFEQGQPVQADDLESVLAQCSTDDVFIKGANALDSRGQAGVLLGMENGGTTGKAIGYVMAKGIYFLIPVGLEKAVLGDQVNHAREMGIHQLDFSSGMPVGLMPLSGNVLTEMGAMQQLARVEVFHVASGGISGGEGAVTLLVKGKEEEVKKILSVYAELRGQDRGYEPACSPALCSEHKWGPCIKTNLYFKENVRDGR